MKNRKPVVTQSAESEFAKLASVTLDNFLASVRWRDAMVREWFSRFRIRNDQDDVPMWHTSSRQMGQIFSEHDFWVACRVDQSHSWTIDRLD